MPEGRAPYIKVSKPIGSGMSTQYADVYLDDGRPGEIEPTFTVIYSAGIGGSPLMERIELDTMLRRLFDWHSREYSIQRPSLSGTSEFIVNRY